MKILTFIEDLSWLDIYEAYFTKLGVQEVIGLALDKEVAVSAAKHYDKIYLLNSVFNPSILMRVFGRDLSEYGFDIAIFPSTNKGRVAAGIYMGLSGNQVITDVLSIERLNNSYKVSRLVYGGTALAEIIVNIPFGICIMKGEDREKPKNRFGEIVRIEAEPLADVSFRAREVTGNDPTSADLVVVAGRGIKKREDMIMIEELAGLTGGAWSVTRPLAADYRWADHWIGISGLVVSPKVYISFGVSGQPHHMMGARSSKYVVAINKDPEAPIFEEADLGIVADLYKILPRLLERLKMG